MVTETQAILLSTMSDDTQAIIEFGDMKHHLALEIKKKWPDAIYCLVTFDDITEAEANEGVDRLIHLPKDAKTLPDRIPPIKFDRIILNQGFTTWYHREQLLMALHDLLSETGVIVADFLNAQFYPIVKQYLSQNFQYDTNEILTTTQPELMTLPNMVKMFMDASWRPVCFNSYVPENVDDGFIASLCPAIQYLGLETQYFASRFLPSHFFFYADRLTKIDPMTAAPITVICATNNPLQLNNNLLASPDLKNNSFHQIVLIEDAKSIADAFERGVQQAIHDFVVLVHQDVYLPKGWFARMTRGWEQAEKQFGEVGVVGAIGMLPNENTVVGRVNDRHLSFNSHIPLPCVAGMVDEQVMAFRRSVFIPKLHAELGFHMYGTDAPLLAEQVGKKTVVVDAPCYHNTSRCTAYGDDALHQSCAKFYYLWRSKLPVYTTALIISENGDVHYK